jgi:hypothetical protein
MTPKEIITHCDREIILKYIDKFTSIEALILDWLETDQNNYFDLGNGLDDDEQFTMVCLCLNRKSNENSEAVAELYYDLKEVISVFNKYPLFESYVTLKENKDSFSSPFTIDEKSFQEFQKSLGFYFHEYLYSQTNNIEFMLPFLMTFALSNGGGTSISRISKNFVEELMDGEDEKWDIDPKNIFFCHSYLSHKNHSTCFDYYFTKDDC